MMHGLKKKQATPTIRFGCHRIKDERMTYTGEGKTDRSHL
jgi:hypothetical protein